MNNLSSYCGLVDAKIRASDKDLPVQIPILVAIFEYGILLAMKKYYQPIKKTSEVVVFNRKIITTDTEEMNMKKIEITMDKWSFIGTLSFIIIFNIIYWTTAIF
jgi:hypothetical protein